MAAHADKRWADLSVGQRRLLVAAAAAEAVTQDRGADRHPAPAASQIRGPKGLWRAAMVVNLLGPVSYFAVGRKRGGLSPPDQSGAAEHPDRFLAAGQPDGDLPAQPQRAWYGGPRQVRRKQNHGTAAARDSAHLRECSARPFLPPGRCLEKPGVLKPSGWQP